MSELAFVIGDLLFEEKSRNLSDKALEELIRNFAHLEVWCTSRINELDEITPQFLLDFMLANYGESGPSTKKSMVWSLRKLGGYLEFHAHLDRNPAGSLKHPISGFNHAACILASPLLRTTHLYVRTSGQL